MTQTPLAQRCVELIEELKLGDRAQIENVEPLSGGVASDIAMVTIAGRTICIKFALAKLKVEEDWRAPVHRNAAEYAWLDCAASVAPNSAVQLFGRSKSLQGFAMAFIEGKEVYLWKTAMLDEQSDCGEAAKVGELIGRIHRHSTTDAFDSRAFHNADDFHALRIEPYLRFTATRHPDLALAIEAVADQLYTSSRVLVHGDVSPKNILFKAGKPVVLDAECATMGNASFDPAFCLNHLILKAVHLPNSRAYLLDAALAWWRAYADQITWEDKFGLQARICRLLPILMLARVDGKSPVEYLSPSARSIVRNLAIDLIGSPKPTLSELVAYIDSTFGEPSK